MKNNSTFINYYYSISFLLLVFSFHSCKDRFECNSQNTVEIPQTLKDYFVFQEGSYWVYKNTKTNELDSMWVDGLDENKYQGGMDNPGSSNYCYKWEITFIKDLKNICPIKYHLNPFGNIHSFDLNFYWEKKNYNEIANYYFLNESFYKKINSSNLIKLRIDSLVINNNLYLNCIEISNFSDDVNAWIFSKNIGLIKFIDSDSNKWEILNYKIIK